MKSGKKDFNIHPTPLNAMTTTNITALALRDAAFAKALDTLTRERASARCNLPMKQRARSHILRDAHIAACERAKEKYRAARALAQKEYLATLATFAPPAEEWEPGLDDDNL